MTDSRREDLLEHIQSRELTVVCGAGVSIAATGGEASVASWTGLLRDGIERCFEIVGVPESAKNAQLEMLRQGDLIHVAEWITEKLGGREAGGEYAGWLEDTVGKLHEQVVDDTLPKAIAALRCPILTTNYDSIISRAAGQRPFTWREPHKIDRFSRGKNKDIFHIHGHWENPESVILGLLKYDHVRRDEPTQNALKALFTMRQMLFVGCGEGMADPNFGALLSWVSDVLRSSSTRHYILVKDDELEEARSRFDLSSLICPLNYGPRHGDLAAYLHDLAPRPATRKGTSNTIDADRVGEKVLWKRELPETITLESQAATTRPVRSCRPSHSWSQVEIRGDSWRIAPGAKGVRLAELDHATDAELSRKPAALTTLAVTPEGTAAAQLRCGVFTIAWLNRHSDRHPKKDWPSPIDFTTSDEWAGEGELLALAMLGHDGVRAVLSTVEDTFVVRARVGRDPELKPLHCGQSRDAVFDAGDVFTIDMNGHPREDRLADVLGLDTIECIDGAGPWSCRLFAAVSNGGSLLTMRTPDGKRVCERIDGGPRELLDLDVVVERSFHRPSRVLLGRDGSITEHLYQPSVRKTE